MTKDKIDAAAAEAKRFLKKYKEFHDAYANQKWHHSFGTKESGALRRASMDLTRALAEMRKP